MKRLIIKPIPVSGIDHPSPPNSVLPKHEWSMGFIAPKGSGKTTCLIRILDFYRGYYHRIVVFSPTVKNDEKWEWVKRQKLLSQNNKLDSAIKDIVSKKRAKNEQGVVDRTHQDNDDPEISMLESYRTPKDFDGTVAECCFLSEYREDTLQQLMDEQNSLIAMLKRNGFSKHYAHRCLLIFDDLVGSSLFSNKARSPFKILAANQRHLSFSTMMVTQAYKEIPKTIRTQFSCLILFEIPNDREVRVIYEENPMNYKHDDWMEMYNHAVEGPHNFMFINYMQPKQLRVMKNFDEYLFIEK